MLLLNLKKEDIHKDLISDEIYKKIELANIQEEWTDVGGYQYPILIANKLIHKNQQLFFDYEPYWNTWLSRQGKVRYFISEKDTCKIVNNQGIETDAPHTDSQNMVVIEKIISESKQKAV